MRFVPRTSVGAQLAIAVLLVTLGTWVVGSGIMSYVSYVQVRTLHRQMLSRPDIYPVPIQEPRFDLRSFFLGPPPPQPLPAGPRPMPPAGQYQAVPPPIQPPRPPINRTGNRDMAALALRASVAVFFSLLAGALLGARFSRKLESLATGAAEFNSGNLGHRVPEEGDDDFTQVAAAMNRMADTIGLHIRGLEDDAQRRRQFLADMAHELRSPVATIRTMAGALQDGVADDGERRMKAVSALVRTSERLTRLISELMDLAKLDLRELPINRAEVDLRRLASAVVDSLSETAVAAGVTLETQDGDPVIAAADADRIAQVLGNLLSNSISHAGRGTVARVLIEDGETVRMTVTDNGRGIPPEHLPHVFDAFYRVDQARTPSQEHCGLGLRISRAIVEAHGGSMTLHSAQHAGTTVTFTLPKATRA